MTINSSHPPCSFKAVAVAMRLSIIDNSSLGRTRGFKFRFKLTGENPEITDAILASVSYQFQTEMGCIATRLSDLGSRIKLSNNQEKHETGI